MPTSLLAWIALSAHAAGCLALPPGEYEQDRLDIRGEQAVIIWDQAHHLEHFIRQAEIDTSTPSVGFLVPTPTVPELFDVDPHIFDLAADVAHPFWAPYRVRHNVLTFAARSLWGPLNLPFTSLLTGMSSKGVGNPVLSQHDVGDYHATILKADDEGALNDWLHANGYALNAADREWINSYAIKKWIITAFQLVEKRRSSSAITSAAVRLSFVTDQPFFPYSEPKKPLSRTGYKSYRTLSVAILSDQRMNGALLEGIKWPAQLRYAGSSKTSGAIWQNELWLTLAHLPASSPLPGYLTYFRDVSNPRPGQTDLVFKPDPVQTPFRLTEIDYGDRRERIDWSHPVSSLLGLAVIGLMTIAPIYAGWRILPRSQNTSLTNQFSIKRLVDRVCGLLMIALAVVEMIIYLGVGVYIRVILRTTNKLVPGEVLPSLTLSMPWLAVAFLGILGCGCYLLGNRLPTSRLGLVLRYLCSLDSLGFGLLAVIVMVATISEINW